MTKKIENEKLVSILAYLIVGIIWFFVDEKIKKSKFAKFHVKQALNLFIIAIVISIIFEILSAILSLITLGLFGFVSILISAILSIFFLILWIIGLLNVINDKKKELPIIGEFADKYLDF